MSTLDKLRDRLQQLEPSQLDIQDDSALHAGHAGNTGGGHYRLFIISRAFENLSLIQRHRLVYETVGDLMESAIHALSIQAKTPREH